MDATSTARNRELLGGMVYPLLDDPLGQGLDRAAALGSRAWARARCSPSARTPSRPTKRIALQNVPAGRTFELFEGPSGAKVGEASSAELRDGIEIELAEKNAARVLLIKAIPPVTVPPAGGTGSGGEAPGEPGAEPTPEPEITAPALPAPLPLPACKRGTRADDRITGTGGDDCIAGGRGDDRLGGGAGDDRIAGGPGDDRITAGPGSDVVDCGPGDDVARIDGSDRVRGCESVKRG